MEEFSTFDLVQYLRRQKRFSQKTFGPGDRSAGIIDHIKKELVEIEQCPKNMALEEWIDVIILALDATWRLGYEAEEVCQTLEYKYVKNMQRKWPDWRTAPKDKAIEHDRSHDGVIQSEGTGEGW